MVKVVAVTAVRGRMTTKEENELKNRAMASQGNAVVVVLILGLLGFIS